MNQLKNNTYPLHGPWIATILIVLTGHYPIVLYEPLRFLNGLINPIIMSGMFLLTVFAMMVGYMIGTLPALLTGHFFNKLIHKNLNNSSQFQFLCSGFMVSFIWLIPISILLFSQFQVWPFALAAFVIICLTSIICAKISWHRYRVSVEAEQKNIAA